MEEVEEIIPHKRKASPSPSQSDGPAKRTKLEGDNSASKDDNHDEAAALERRRPQSPSPIATSPSATRAAVHDHEAPRRSPEIRRQPPQPAAPPGKKPFSQEEKKRGQRLFGGLLSTLSQKPTNSQQRRRQDIERRQQERAQQQRAEDDKRRVEKLARIKVTRQIEEIKFDEEVMRTRHEHLLSRARYLKTRSQPSIYYLPWETTKEQDATIKEQTRLAEETITREKADFKARKECRLRDLGVSVYLDEPGELDDKQDQTRKETVGEPTSPSHSTNPPPPQADHHHSSPRKHHDSKHHDETGDELMQDAEDTVIY